MGKLGDALADALEGGERKGFDEVFPGYAPSSGLVSRDLPFRRVRIGLVVDQDLQDVLPAYDANANAELEREELAVLYLSEAARGLGHDVQWVGKDAPAGALALPTADVGGIVREVEGKRSSMSRERQAMFLALERLGIEVRTNQAPFGDTGGRRVRPTR